MKNNNNNNTFFTPTNNNTPVTPNKSQSSNPKAEAAFWETFTGKITYRSVKEIEELIKKYLDSLPEHYSQIKALLKKLTNSYIKKHLDKIMFDNYKATISRINAEETSVHEAHAKISQYYNQMSKEIDKIKSDLGFLKNILSINIKPEFSPDHFTNILTLEQMDSIIQDFVFFNDIIVEPSGVGETIPSYTEATALKLITANLEQIDTIIEGIKLDYFDMNPNLDNEENEAALEDFENFSETLKAMKKHRLEILKPEATENSTMTCN